MESTRRGFLSAMIKAGSACAVLPCAVTYSRIWVPKSDDHGVRGLTITEMLEMRNLGHLVNTLPPVVQFIEARVVYSPGLEVNGNGKH